MITKALPSFAARWRSTLIAACFLLACCPVRGGMSQIPQLPPQAPATHTPMPSDVLKEGDDPLAATNSAKLEHMREDDRRKRLLSDTAKLVELSNQLKSDVENTPKDQLSLDVVRKAAEIEKLAHDVKERMKS